MADYPKKYVISLLFLLLTSICFYGNKAAAQPGWSASRFSNMSNQERFRYVHDYPFYKIVNGIALTALFEQMRGIAQKEGDVRTGLAVDFYNCVASGNTGVKTPRGIGADSLFRDVERRAKESNYPVEEAVARFNIIENEANTHKITYEQRYTSLIDLAEHMHTIGYEKFRDYYIENIMLRIAMVMWDLEDYEKAYHYLSIAERFVVISYEGNWHYTQVMSYLQTYWKIKKDYERSLQYAFKIKNLFDNFKPSNRENTEFANFWRGFSTIEIADLLIKQGKLAEGERYADKGYLLSKAPVNPVSYTPAYQAEYDALMVLIDVKLSLGKMQEAGIFLQRAQQLKTWLQAKNELGFFKPLRLYGYLADYNEKKGEAATALSYMHRAAQLQDSLDKRNDVHKLAQAQQRFDAERYAQKIAAVEKEKKLEKMLRQASVTILVLVIAFGALYFKNLQVKRRQKEIELAATTLQLQQQTKTLREKSELADSLYAEIEQLSQSGQRSENLEQLTRSTILTEDDWVAFRALFEKVYPSFITEKKQQYPGITPAEIRLMVLEKLELNTQEMANMLGVSKNTIHQTRLRLRKKMEAVSA